MSMEAIVGFMVLACRQLGYDDDSIWKIARAMMLVVNSTETEDAEQAFSALFKR